MKLNPFSLIAIGFVLVSLVGCGGTHRDLPERNYVKGTVTLDGEPIEKGSISFASDKDVASGMPFSGNITDGTYQLQVTPGQKKVKINCIVGGKGIEGEFKNLVHPKYNSQTTLTANVTGNDTFDFEVTSK